MPSLLNPTTITATVSSPPMPVSLAPATAVNLQVAAVGPWADATYLTGPALQTALSNLVTGLAATTGAAMLGAGSGAGTYYSRSGTINNQLGQLLSAANTNAANIDTKGGLSTVNPWTAANTFDDITATSSYKVSEQTLSRIQVMWVIPEGSTTWTYPTTNFTPSQATNTTDHFWAIPILSHDIVIDRIRVTIEPSGGHVAIPSVRPAVELFSVSTSGGSPTSLGFWGDNPGNLATYESVHTFNSPSGLNITTDRTTKRYFFVVTGESSTNSLATPNVRIHAINIDQVVDAVDPIS